MEHNDLQKGDKVYVLSKSSGASLRNVRRRRTSVGRVYKTKTIVYNGYIIKDAIVAYYRRLKDRRIYVLTYERNVLGGDFYLKLDFVTEKEVINQNLLPDHLFDI